MADLTGMAYKFSVLKNDDVEKLDHKEKVALGHIVERLIEIRGAEGKKTDNKYLIINTDEPYADEIIEIMKRHGHWG